MFQKLKCTFDIEEYKILKQKSCFLQGDRGIRYSEVALKQFSDIFNLIPPQYQIDFCLLLMQVNTKIPPHTDSGIKTTINVYIKTDSCLTQFYELKTDRPHTTQVQNQTDGFLFDESDLNPTVGFIAKPTECWLLDVTKIHGVLPLSEFNSRIAISLASNKYDYSEVCDMLRETGNL